MHFVDAAAEAGLLRPTWCGSTEKPHILESGGTGLAVLDYDVDGDLDLYLINGWRNEGAEILERGRNYLYRNSGQGIFEDVTETSGTGDEGWGTGIAVGDFDRSGFPDLFVSNFGADILYVNRGDGKFEVVEEGPSIDGWSTGAVFFDADRDGDEDLYVGAYIDCTLEEVLNAEPELDWEGVKVMLGPFGLEGKANRYFENLGQGGFKEATVEAGLEDKGLYYSFGVIAADMDGDLDLDLYIANDSNPNYLYANDGTGRFQEVGLWSGAAVDSGGMAQAGMGLGAGDLDDDGLLDVLVTNFNRDTSTLYWNLGDMLFEDRTLALGLRELTYDPLSWGTALADLDLDGGLEVFIANGHIYPQADLVPQVGVAFRQTNLLMVRRADRFVNVTANAGPGLAVRESSRGVATGDLDGDGDLDLVVANVDAAPTLLRNESARQGGWLLVDAPGALLVVVEAGGRRFLRHRVIGSSYVSASDPRFHFGLGPAERIERLTVLWDDGSRTVLNQIATDSIVHVRRGKALPGESERGRWFGVSDPGARGLSNGPRSDGTPRPDSGSPPRGR